MTTVNAVEALAEAYQPESYWPDEYVAGAVDELDRLGVLARPVTGADRAAAESVLAGLHDTDLDVQDVFPFGVVWSLRASGAITGTAELDDTLQGWRDWEETDHCEVPLDFLPRWADRP